jgi:hypothetical protein
MPNFTVFAEAADNSDNAGLLAGCYANQSQSGQQLKFARDPNHDMVTCVYNASRRKAKVNFVVKDAAGNRQICAFRFFSPENPTATFRVVFALLLAAFLRLPPNANAQESTSILPAAAAEYVAEYIEAVRRNDEPAARLAIEALSSPDVLREAITKHTAKTAAAVPTAAEARSVTGGEITAKRIDKQIGETANAAGTTSLVSKAGSAGLAAEFANGALTRTKDGNTTTFRLNALKVYELFKGREEPTCLDVAFCAPGVGDALKNFNLVAAIDTTGADTLQTSEVRNVATGASSLIANLTRNRRLSSWGARYEFTWQDRANGERWDKLMTNLGKISAKSEDLAKKASGVDNAIMKIPAHKKLQESLAARAKIHKNSSTALLADYARLLDEHIPEIATAIDEDAWKELETARKDFIASRDEIINATLFRTTISAEATHQRPSDKPEMVNFRFALTRSLGQRAATEAADKTAASAISQETDAKPTQSFSVNLAGTVYTKKPSATISHWRDVQAALQWERLLGPSSWKKRPAFALSGFYQYMIENGVIEFDEQALAPGTRIELVRSAAEVLDTKGHIGIAQAKVTIPLGRSGLSIPAALSWSNRTELVKANEWRGQFGISLDFDMLFDALK